MIFSQKSAELLSNHQSQDSDKKAKKSLRLIPLTIKSVLDICKSSTDDEKYEIDGIPFEQCTIVGRIYKYYESESGTMTFGIDDTTAKLILKLIQKDVQSIYKTSKRTENIENTYIKAVLSIKPYKEKNVYFCMRIKELYDFNQISYHMLSCFLARKRRSENVLPENNESIKDPNQLIKTKIFELMKKSKNGYCDRRKLLAELSTKLNEDQISTHLMLLISNDEVMDFNGSYVLIEQNAFLG